MKKPLLISAFCSILFLSAFAQQPANTNFVQAVDQRETIYLTKAEFVQKVADYEKNPKQWVYLGDKPCIIDFYTTWCGPCKRLAPILEEIAKEYKGKIYVYKVDAEKELQLSIAFGIKSYPSLLFCPKSGNPQMALGALPKEDLLKIIDQLLLGKAEPAKAEPATVDSFKKKPAVKK